MTLKDLRNATITGLTTGTIAWRLFEYLEISLPLGIPLAALIAIVPICWVAGVWLGYFLGQWFGFFSSFGKFCAIGFTNAMVDFGVFNLLFSLSGEKSSLFPVFSAISFIFGVTHSYFWNKYWTFNAAKSNGGRREFLIFFTVALLALLVNVGVSSAVFYIGSNASSIDSKVLANLGKVAGSAAGLLFSFVGFRLVVFRRKS